MTKDSIIETTKNLYQLTLLFPKKEPLRYKMRELADEILTKIRRLEILANPGNKKTEEEICSSVLEDLDILDCFFEIVKEQNWVKTNELFHIQSDYQKLTHQLEIKKNKIQLEKVVIEKEINQKETLPQLESYEVGKPLALTGKTSFLTEDLSQRQEKILALLREKGKVQVWQVKQVLPEVTKRTLRRDFERLLRKGMIERVGERNNTFYQIKVS